MPDQSNAAEEHALLTEINDPLDRLGSELPDDEDTVDFPVVLRGYDRLAVDAYVKQLGRQIADLEAQHTPDAAVRRALERVGEDVAGILQRAHDTASQITRTSRREAEERLEIARREAAEMTAAAERRLRQIDVDADRIWAERQRILDDARELAGQLLLLSESAAERFPAAEEDIQTSEIQRNGLVPPPVSAQGEEPSENGSG